MKFIKKYPYQLMAVFIITLLIKAEICLIQMGFLFIYLAYSSYTVIKRIKKYGIQCAGKVIEYNVDGQGLKIPLIQFTTHANQTLVAEPYIFTATDLNLLISFSKEQSDVLLKYDPIQPDHFLLIRQTGFTLLVFWLLIFGGFLLLFLGIAILLNYIN